MILVDVVFLHSAVTSGCRLSSEMSMTVTTPENTESFSTRAFQATASIMPSSRTLRANIAQSGGITIVHPEPRVSRLRQILYRFLISVLCTRVFTSNLIANYCSA